MLLKGSSEDILVQLHFKYSRNKQYADLLIGNIPIPIVSSYHIYIMCTIHVHVHLDYIQYNVSKNKERKTNKHYNYWTSYCCLGLAYIEKFRGVTLVA